MLNNQLNHWAPASDLCTDATARLQNYFHSYPDPNVDVIFPELLTANYSEISHEKWSGYLLRIGTNISCHDGAFQSREWFNYLMARVNLIGTPDNYQYRLMVEQLFEDIYAVYPQQLPEEIRIDLLSTVGKIILQTSFWQNDQYQENPAYYCYLPYLFSNVLLFNLKYRKADEIFPWIESMCSIKCVKWRSYLLLWFVGLIDLFEGRYKTVEDFSSHLTNFNLSHCLSKESKTIEEYFQESIIQEDPEHFAMQRALQGQPLPLLNLHLCFNCTYVIPVSDWFSADTLSELKHSISRVLTKKLLNEWFRDFENAPGRTHAKLISDLESYPQAFLEYY